MRREVEVIQSQRIKDLQAAIVSENGDLGSRLIEALERLHGDQTTFDESIPIMRVMYNVTPSGAVTGYITSVLANSLQLVSYHRSFL